MRFFRMFGVLVLTGTFLFAQEMKTISLDVQDADIKTVLRAFSKVAGVNIITTPSVNVKVTFSVKNVPWKEAFRALLEAYNLSYVEQENIIIVMTQEEYGKFRDVAGLEMKIFRLKYVKAKDVAGVVEGLLSPRGKMKIETGTNALIVKDLPENILKVERLLKKLDKPNQQVLIKVRVVEMDYDAARSLGVQWVIDHTTQGDDPLYKITHNTTVGGPSDVLNIGKLLHHTNVDIMLQTLENESKAKIISAPSVVALNNHKARVISGKKVPVVMKDISGNSVVKFVEAAVSLEVTPHITPDGEISLELHPMVGDIAGFSPTGQPIITIQEVETRLNVKSGETIVLGGVIKESKRKGAAGFPILHRIPIINLIFGNRTTSSSRVELMVFVTPYIINNSSEAYQYYHQQESLEESSK